jgi:uncharacterized protein (DUF302 family)
MIKQITIERFNVISTRSFEEVIRGLDKGIGRPNMRALEKQMDEAASLHEYERVIHGAVGSADLMEFLRLDLGEAIQKDPRAKSYKIVRIIAGNPLIMRQMAEHVPDAGSYAPVTILVYEGKDGVHLCYDTMASFLAPYENEGALKVAKSLDEKVIKLLNEAAG